MSIFSRLLLLATILFLNPIVQADDAPYQVAIFPDNSFNAGIVYHGNTIMTWNVAGWGANWSSFGGANANDRAPGAGQPLKTNADMPFGSNSIHVELDADTPSDRTLSLIYNLTAKSDVPTTMLAMIVNVKDGATPAHVTLTDNGKDVEATYPIPNTLATTQVSKAVFHTTAGDITATFDPPIPVGADSDLRIKLASDTVKAGTSAVHITLTFPEAMSFAATDDALKPFNKELAGPDWFPFVPKDFTSPSVIGMEDWLDKPAGGKGGVRMVGDHFELEDGTKIKFWGTNLAYTQCAPVKADADSTVARFSKLGMNAVRLHKFTNPGEGIGDPVDPTKFDPAGLSQLDYFTSQLAAHGTYFGFSHSYHYKIRSGDKGKLLAYDEVMSKLGGDTYGIINCAEDLQDEMISTVVSLLNHTNPNTGKTYAQDPALAWIELQNEDDIFFFSFEGALQSCPTYKKKFFDEFNDWLQNKYGSQDKLAAAWGDALQSTETLSAKSVQLEMNPWFFSTDNLVKKADGTHIQIAPGVTPSNQDGALRRAMDMASFLHDTQNKFYTKFVKAIRDTGYKGPIEGSPWQGVAGIPNYYNLRSDYLAGFIDRHNYGAGDFAGTILSPGLGLFSVGLQQVLDRPFTLSEWTNVHPNHYLAEAPAMVAVYGLGLQGWDGSYQFTSQVGPGYSLMVGSPAFNIWRTDVPANAGQYPALSRMIYRGDVKEADPISIRKVSLEELEQGHLSFSDTVVQNGDVKSFTGVATPETMLAGRCVVQFTDKPEASVLPDLTKYQNGAMTTSSTGQLVWDATKPDHCSFTVDTPGTKAMVGFAENKTAKLGNVTLTSHNPYVSLFLTSLEKTANLDTTKSALVSIISRNTTSGLKVCTIDNHILDQGNPNGPIVLEPVQADIAFSGRTVSAVNVLDVDGKRTDKTVPVDIGVIHLDTGRDKTMYYEIVF